MSPQRLIMKLFPHLLAHYHSMKPNREGPAHLRGDPQEIIRNAWQPATEILPSCQEIAKRHIFPILVDGRAGTNPARDKLIAMFEKFLSDPTCQPESEIEEAVLVMTLTRQERYERLHQLLGCPLSKIPKEFQLYRFIESLWSKDPDNDRQFIRNILRQFYDKEQDDFLDIDHASITCWSYEREGALSTAKKNRFNGVLLQTIIPQERIISDILVDNSAFTRFWEQAEAVVYTAPGNEPPQVSVASARIILQGKEFTKNDFATISDLLR